MKLAPKIMNEVFDFIECQYPLKNELRFKSRNIPTVRYGIETMDPNGIIMDPFPYLFE